MHNIPKPNKILVAISIAIAFVIATFLAQWLLSDHGDHHGHAAHMPHYWGIGILPFLVILGSIALLPLIPATHMWWESNANRFFIAMLCAGGTILYLFVTHREDIGPSLHHAIMQDYIPFIILLFSLYVIAGGIHLSGDLEATPLTNSTFLAAGALMASFVGTTGASMLLIRPILKTNSQRKHIVHTVVVFIFLVSNIGGTLLPIGDPPLFLGYLRGVDFLWTLNLWPMWATTCGILLVVYYIWDSILWRKEGDLSHLKDDLQAEPIRVRGLINFVYIGGIVAAAALIDSNKTLPLTDWKPFPYLRELVMLFFVGLSLISTSKAIKTANNFTYGAILEVAALFSGIFIAMQVPLAILRASGEAITATLNQPWQYFWATGTLSSFLDNAPTYVVFFKLAQSLPSDQVMEVNDGTIPITLLVAISLGSVFMGSMTYIGNGPNFMVKAIAEQEGIKMPSFFGYMFKYSIPVLVPIFILVTFLFLL